MKVSLVMPVYNAAATVRRSIESFQGLSKVLDNGELWIVDDCSTDGSFEQIEKMVKSSRNIKLLRNTKNSGPGLARNRALEEIHSGYIGFIDSDDEIIPTGYVRVLAAGHARGADFITFCGWTKRGEYLHRKYDFDRIVDDTGQLTRNCVRGELDGSVIFSIYSADIIHKNKLRFPSGYFEDIPFSYGAMLLANNRLISQEFAYQKNSRKNSIVNTITRAHIDGMLESCITVRRNTMSYGLANYAEFEDDFIYGAHGYLAQSISFILLNSSSDDEKIALLSYLHERISDFGEFECMPLRTITKKDKLVRHYFSNFRILYRTENTDKLLKELVSYRDQLFNAA